MNSFFTIAARVDPTTVLVERDQEKLTGSQQNTMERNGDGKGHLRNHNVESQKNTAWVVSSLLIRKKPASPYIGHISMNTLALRLAILCARRRLKEYCVDFSAAKPLQQQPCSLHRFGIHHISHDTALRAVGNWRHLPNFRMQILSWSATCQG